MLERVKRVARPGALLLAALCALACVATRLPPLEQTFPLLEEDERELWSAADRIDSDADGQPWLYVDESLDAYLNALAARLQRAVGREHLPARVRVLLDPWLNAFALPNGSVYLHSGILANLENEAQLATLLGHELAHVWERHALEKRRGERNTRLTAQVLTALTGSVGDPTMLSWAEEIVTSQVNGYSREREREADAAGLEVTVAAGYDPAEAPALFERLLREVEQGWAREEPYLYGSHPHLAERIASYRDFLTTRTNGSRGGRRGSEEFTEAVAELLLVNARLDVRLGRRGSAQRAIERHLRVRADSVEGHLLLGELHRGSGSGPEALGAALQAFEAAARIDPGHAASFRELGLVYRALGRDAEARSALARYLELAPRAADRAILERYLEALAPTRRDGG